jgi:glutaredoxin
VTWSIPAEAGTPLALIGQSATRERKAEHLMTPQSSAQIKVYGATWCHDTQDTVKHLDSLGVEYEYLDVDQDPHAHAWVKDHNDGKQKLPTLDVGGQILSVPDIPELDEALRAKGIVQ